MSKQTIGISCSLCEDSYETEIETEGWTTRYNSVSTEDGFCPKHSVILEFTDSQCIGCVGGWGECDLFKSFAYSKYNVNPLDDNDFKKIECGICPRRTNGTFSFNTNERILRPDDLSEQATDKSGMALATAIKEYIKKYE